MSSHTLQLDNHFRRRPWRRRLTGAELRLLLALLLAGLVGYFVVYPLASILWESVWSPQAAQLTVGAYHDALSDRIIRRAITNSAIIAVGTTVISGFMGVFLAWIVARTNTPWRGALTALNLLPFFFSPFVLAIAWRLLGAPNNGLLNQAFMNALELQSPPINIYSIGGIIWVLCTFFTPYIYLFALGSFKRMDAYLEEAARISGANLLQTLWRVTLPLSAPAVLAGLVLVFVTSGGIIDVPLLLGDPHQIFTLPTVIYNAINIYPPRYDIAAVVASGLVVITFVAVALQQGYLRRRSFVTQSSRANLSLIDLRAGRYATLGFTLLYLLVCVGLPVAALLMASVSPFWSGTLDLSNLTLRHYEYVLFEYELTWRSLRNTAVLAIGGATLTVMIAIGFVYVVHRMNVPFGRFMETVAALPVTVPGVVVGMGFLIIWVGSFIYATLWILLVVYIIAFLGIALRVQAAALASVGNELEEAGRVAGASLLRTMRWILIPLLKTGTISAWLILFIIFVRELSASVLLWSPGNEVLSVAILIASAQKTLPVVAAFSLLQVLILLSSAFVFLRWFASDEIKI